MVGEVQGMFLYPRSIEFIFHHKDFYEKDFIAHLAGVV